MIIISTTRTVTVTVLLIYDHNINNTVTVTVRVRHPFEATKKKLLIQGDEKIQCYISFRFHTKFSVITSNMFQLTITRKGSRSERQTKTDSIKK